MGRGQQPHAVKRGSKPTHRQGRQPCTRGDTPLPGMAGAASRCDESLVSVATIQYLEGRSGRHALTGGTRTEDSTWTPQVWTTSQGDGHWHLLCDRLLTGDPVSVRWTGEVVLRPQSVETEAARRPAVSPHKPPGPHLLRSPPHTTHKPQNKYMHQKYNGRPQRDFSSKLFSYSFLSSVLHTGCTSGDSASVEKHQWSSGGPPVGGIPMVVPRATVPNSGSSTTGGSLTHPCRPQQSLARPQHPSQTLASRTDPSLTTREQLAN